MTDEEHDLDFHEGEVLYRNLAATYGTLPRTVVEEVQNGVDAGAPTVFVGIDRQTWQVIILDNGAGITVEKCKKALTSVGKGIKPRKDKMGRFGLGMVSPLDKCESFTIISQPEGEDVINQWMFEGAKIRLQRTVKIPYKRAVRFPPLPRQFKQLAEATGATWRTHVRMNKVIPNRATTSFTLEELKFQIQDMLGDGMRLVGTTVHVALIDEEGQLSQDVIEAPTYTGTPLKPVTYRHDSCGTVRFELYVAPKEKGARSGRVVFKQSGDLSRVGVRDVRVQAMGLGWMQRIEGLKEAFDILGSGSFQGEVSVDGITLVDDRKKFAVDDALVGMYHMLVRWVAQHGRQHYAAEQEASNSQHLVNRGAASLQRSYEVLRGDPLLAEVTSKLRDFGRAAPAPKPRSEKESEDKSPRKKRLTTKPPARTRSPKKAAPEDDAREENKSDPVISFAYEMMPGSPHLWEFDFDTHQIVFNIRHPIWVDLDQTGGKRTAKNDRQVMHLQEWHFLEVAWLLAETSDPEEFNQRRGAIDSKVKAYKKLFIEKQ